MMSHDWRYFLENSILERNASKIIKHNEYNYKNEVMIYKLLKKCFIWLLVSEGESKKNFVKTWVIMFISNLMCELLKVI